MDKPKIDIDGDGDGDIGKGAIKIILGLIISPKKTINSLGNNLSKLATLAGIVVGIVILFWVIIGIIENIKDNGYVKDYVEVEVIEKHDGQATIKLTELNDFDHLKIGWATMLLYNQDTEQFIDSAILPVERFEQNNWTISLQKDETVYFSFYSIHNEPLEDIKITYGFRIKDEDWITARHYEDRQDFVADYPGITLPIVASADTGSELVSDIDIFEERKLAEKTPREWMEYNTITEDGSTVLANMTYTYCKRKDEGENVSSQAIKELLLFSSPYQISPYHENKYGLMNAMEIAEDSDCDDLVEMFKEWW